jgi:hypothetical protein
LRVAWLVAVALAVGAMAALPDTAHAVPATSISGPDRYTTAAAISKRAYPGTADTVIITNGMAWADALGGSALAGVVDGPILLSQKDRIPSAVASELGRLDPSRVYLLGGTASLAPGIVTQVQQILGSGVQVERIGGSDRYTVAIRTAAETADLVGGPIGTAFVATGRIYTDALSCAPVAASQGWPIYIMDPARAPGPTISAMKAAGVTRVVIAGGPVSVPYSTSSALESAFGASNVSRLSGTDRYQVAVRMSDFAAAYAGFGSDAPGFASGEAYADALAGGVYLGKQKSPLLLVAPSRVPDSVAARLWARRATMQRFTFFGGPVTVPWHVRLECQHALRAPHFSKYRAKEHVYAIAGFGVRAAGSWAERKAADYCANELTSYGYTVTKQYFSVPGGKTSVNVVAERTGTTDDTIVLGGHIDSKPPSPGGNDNASGAAVMLELARVLAVSDAAPTIRFVAFGAEEISGPTPDDHHFGSRHYVATMSSAEKSRTEGMVSIDMVGYGGTFNVRNMGYSKMSVVDSLKSWGKYSDEPLAYLKDPGWSDHDSFEYAGIPAAWIEWRDDPVYHTARDTAGHVQYDRVERSGRLMRGWVLDLTEAEVAAFK